MKDKKQIIIDGVNIRKCPYLYIDPKTGAIWCTERRFGGCQVMPNCRFKEVTRLKRELKAERIRNTRLQKRITKELIKQERYRKALEEIEKIAQNGLSLICYKSNCSRCRCYEGDDCNASMTSLINNYFTENGDFVDGNCDFVEALEGLLEDERKKCNKAIPIVQQILDIINKAKGEE